jgi:hypothetical protein
MLFLIDFFSRCMKISQLFLFFFFERIFNKFFFLKRIRKFQCSFHLKKKKKKKCPH